MEKIEKNIMTCDYCGQRIKVKNNITLYLILTIGFIIGYKVFYQIVKSIIMKGHFMNAYNLMYGLVFLKIAIAVSIVHLIFKCFKGGGHCTCPKCLTKYKFNKEEYKNKKFNVEA